MFSPETSAGDAVVPSARRPRTGCLDRPCELVLVLRRRPRRRRPLLDERVSRVAPRTPLTHSPSGSKAQDSTQPPRHVVSHGLGGVPTWFVRTDDLIQARSDELVTPH